MIATQVSKPFHRDGWVYEEKIDGWRMLAYKDGRTVRLESRNGVDHTRRFPDLAAAVAALPGRTLVIDGEVAIFDRQLRSRCNDALALVALPGSGRLTWGQHGGRTLSGNPCGQTAAAGERCGHHPAHLDADPEGAAAHRAAFSRSGVDGRLAKRSPQQRQRTDPHFTSTEDVLRWAEATMGAVRRKEYADWRAIDAELKLARLVLDALGQAQLDALADLERLVRSRLEGGRSAA
jgi:hypothetical protein